MSGVGFVQQSSKSPRSPEVIAAVRRSTSPKQGWDVFISYVYAERAKWEPVIEALRREGISVFQDYRDITTFDSITKRVKEGLASSRIFLALWSTAYPTRRICQWELTAAYTAAESKGPASFDQVLVVRTSDVPIDDIPLPRIRDLIVGEASQPQVIVEAVKRKLASDLPRFGEISQEWPPWYPLGERPQRPQVFVGRSQELWQLHTELRSQDAEVATGRFNRGHAQVVGLAGAGKTMLVQEYASRFRSAYPGGVVWFRVPSAAEERKRGWLGLLFQLGQDLKLTDLGEANVAQRVSSELTERGKNFLWVFDGVGPDVSLSELKGWLALSEPGAAVLTTQSQKFTQALGGAVYLRPLDSDASLDLITQGDATSVTEIEEAKKICELLGHHALAVAVAGAYVSNSPLASFSKFLRQLQQPSEDHLERAESLVEGLGLELPTGHEVSVTSVMIHAVEALSESGEQVLQLVAQLASSPIPILVLDGAFHDPSRQPGAISEALEQGLMECRSRSLLDGDTDLVRAHGIVSRTVRYHANADVMRARRGRLIASSWDLAKRYLSAQAPSDLRLLSPHLLALLSTPELSAIEYVYAASACTWSGLAADAIHCAEEALSRAKSPEEQHMALDQLAGAYHAAGRHADAREVHVDKLLPLLIEELNSGSGHPQLRRLLGNVASTLIRSGESERAAEVHALSEGRDRDKKLLQMRSLLDAINHLAQNRETVTRGSLAAAGGAAHADEAMVLLRKAQIMEHDGECDQAIAMLDEASKAAESRLGPEHFSTIGLLHELGRMLNNQEKYQHALPINKRVYEWRVRHEGERHPHTLAAGQNYADSMVQLQHPDAVDFCRTVLANKMQVPSMGAESIRLAVASLARALLDTGQVAECRKLLEEHIRKQPEPATTQTQVQMAGLLLETELLSFSDVRGTIAPLQQLLDGIVPRAGLSSSVNALLMTLKQQLSRHQDSPSVASLLPIAIEGVIQLAPSYGDDGAVARAIAAVAVTAKVECGEASPQAVIAYFARKYFNGDKTWIERI
jgi:tetratricopeptide (TPR) repeat protein